MAIVLDGVRAADLAACWPVARPWVERALAVGAGHFTAADVRAALEDRAMQLWLLRREDGDVAGALVTEIVTYPRLTVCRLVLAGAEDGARADWLAWRPLIEAWAREQGCTVIELYGRPGWARVVPWARRRVVLEWPIPPNSSSIDGDDHGERRRQ